MKSNIFYKDDEFVVQVAQEAHKSFSEQISDLIEESSKMRDIGIARRSPAYISNKIDEGKAVIALHTDGRLAGFCYIETWTHGKYVANSGLIVSPDFRGKSLGRRIKDAAFGLSRRKYPNAKIFSITTSHAVMKMNSELGYKPVPFSELTGDDQFWDGCQTCKNYDILTRNNRKYCLCTGLIFDPEKPHKAVSNGNGNNRVVLAFSGGLDTSYCAKYLSEDRGLEVHSVIVNTGGFSAEELAEIEARAYALGVKKHIMIDETANYYQRCIKYLIFGNVLKNNTYPLSVSSERVFQAAAIAEYAREINAAYVAHGSTGAGNDQVRFDLVFNILIPGVEILTPIRDMKISRNEEITFLKKHDVDIDWTKAQYSINKGLWGTSVGGKETLTSSDYLPEEAFPTQLDEKEPQSVKLRFEQGELVAVNDDAFDNPVHAIRQLEELAGPYAIGRDIHVGDTIIGIKGRVGFEAAAPLMIIKAHHALEKHLLTKWQLYWKDQLANWYGSLLHEGQYFEPVMRQIEAFMEDSQKNVSGTVELHMAPYRFHVLGIESPFDLMSPDFATYGEMNNSWSGDDVRGFSKIFANQAKIHYQVNRHYEEH